MWYKLCRVVGLVVIFLCLGAALTEDRTKNSGLSGLPPIETFVVGPIDIENISFWVPTTQVGPEINRSCRARNGCTFSMFLPASVDHTKTPLCIDEVGRLLAEYTCFYHENNMPLTISNGWQWEYSYSLCEFIEVRYNLPRRGGAWWNSWEGMLTQSAASVSGRWTQIDSSGNILPKTIPDECKSNIDVRTFSFVRTRNGYPKERQF